MTLFLSLLAFWLLLQGSLGAADVLTGLAVAGAAMLGYARLRTSTQRPRSRPRAVLELLVLLVDDIVRSNYGVARIVLGLHRAPRRSGFLRMPLEVRDPRGLAVLACIVTATPGTAWARYDAAASAVLIHVLDLRDEQAWIREFKARYERRVLEIFP